jgi:hypothetical protein
MRFICKIEWHLMSGTSSVSSHLTAQNSQKPSHHRASGHAGGTQREKSSHANSCLGASELLCSALRRLLAYQG